MRAETHTQPNALSDRYFRPREDDFRRLGLGTSEARVAIIREAAQRAIETARAPADQDSPTIHNGESEIAQVVTSVYRLLDPRRRDAVIERIQLVRFEPTPVRTWLWGNPDTATESSTEGLESETSSHDEDWMLEMLADLRTDLPSEREAASPASRRQTATLRDRGSKPLIHSQTLRQKIGANRWMSMGLIGTAVLVGLMGLAFFIAALGSSNSGGPPTGVSADSLLPNSPTRNVTGEVGAVGAVDPSLGDVRENLPASDAGNDESAAGDASTEPVDDVQSPPAVASGSEATESDPSMLSHLSVNPGTKMPSLGDVLNSENSTELGGDPAAVASGAADSNSSETESGDWLVGIVPEPIPGQPEAELEDPQTARPPTSNVLPTEAGSEPLLEPAPLPDAPALQAAQSDIEQQLAASGPSVALGIDYASELWKQSREQPDGSAHRIAFAWATGRQLVMIGRLAEAMAVVQQTTREYEVAEAATAFEVLKLCSDAAVTSSEYEHLCEWGIRCSELALLREDFELAGEAARLATVAAVATQEVDLRDRCRTQRDAISTAERMADTVTERLMGNSIETATVRDSALIGRHLCLNLRRWEAGLPWLAKAEIARLSRCAQDELMVGDNPGPKNLAELGRGWLEAAESQRAGRIADSMRARGRDLLQQACDATQGVQQLELQKELRELDEDFPADLLPLPMVDGQQWLIAVSGGPVVNTNAGNSATAPAPVAPEDGDPGSNQIDTLPPSRGMLATLTVGNHPTAMGIRFSPRVPLSELVFQNLLRLEDMPAEMFRLEAHGYFQVDALSRIRLFVRGPVGLQETNDATFANYDSDGMRVLLNNRQVPLKLVSDSGPGARSLEFELAPGLYRLVWQFQGQRMPPAELRVLNVDTGEELPLQNDLISRRAVRQTPISRWVVLRPSAAMQ